MFLSIDASGKLRQFEVKPGQTVMDAIMEELNIKDREDMVMFVPRFLTRAIDIPCVVMIGRRADQEEQNEWNRNNVASILWAWERDDVIFGKVVLAEGTCNGPEEQTAVDFGRTRNAVEKLCRLAMVLPFE